MCGLKQSELDWSVWIGTNFLDSTDGDGDGDGVVDGEEKGEGVDVGGWVLD